MASTFAEKNQEFAKSTTDNAAQSGKKKKQSPFQGMYYCKVGCEVSKYKISLVFEKIMNSPKAFFFVF